MGDVTLRDLDEAILSALQRRAANHGRSLAEELSAIIREVVSPDLKAEALAAADAIRGRAPIQTTDSTDLVRQARDNR